MTKRYKLKILLMTPSLNWGGEEFSTLKLARELNKRGHEAIYMSSGGPLEEKLRDANIRFIKADIKGRSPAGILKGAHEIKRFIENESVSIIHAQTPWPALMSRIALFMAKENAPIIWHDRGIKANNYRIVCALANRYFDQVIANSEHEANLLLQKGLDPAKLKRIYNGLCLEDYEQISKKEKDLKRSLGIGEDTLLVGMVGRLHPEKGPKWFVKAAAIVCSRDSTNKIMFVLVGDGPERKELDDLSRGLGLDGKIFFLGFRDDVPNILKQLDILVVPSEAESFGNIVIEGMLMGVPVIATRVGGMKEIIKDGIDGIYVEPKDPAAIARKINILVEDERFRKSITLTGEQKVRSYFNISRLTDEMEDVYEKLLA